MTEKHSYMAVMPQGDDFFFDIPAEVDRDNRQYRIINAVREEFSRRGELADVGEPRSVKVRCWRLIVCRGQIQKEIYFDIDVPLYFKRMTEAQFNVQQAELLTRIPTVFHGPVSSLAWEDGHSAGYEEVILYVSKYVDWLSPPLNAYAKELKNDVSQQEGNK